MQSKHNTPITQGSIKQGIFIRKIESYLNGRGRENLLSKRKIEGVEVEGLCNGASLLLLERVFYDCLNRHYLTQLPLDVLLEKVLHDFFKEIETIIATDDNLLDSPDFKKQLDKRKNPEYKEAKHKLDQAQVKIPNDIKEKYLIKFKDFFVYDGKEKQQQNVLLEDYFLTYLNLAQQQNILTEEEAKILKEAHIPDIPQFEQFISSIFFLQIDDENFLSQDAIAEKFAQLKADVKEKPPLPLPMLENQYSFVGSPEELMKNLENLFPDERLVRINLPEHTVAAFKINNTYYFYDPNADKKNFVYCEGPLIFILKLSLTELRLAANNEKMPTPEEVKKGYIEYIDYKDDLFTGNLDASLIMSKSRTWLAQKPAYIQYLLLNKAMNDLINELNEGTPEDSTVVTTLLLLPQTLGFSWKVYAHPNSRAHQYPSGIKLLFTDTQPDQIDEKLQQADFSNETLIIKLIETGQRDVLQEIFAFLNKLPPEEQKKHFNHRDANGNTPLHFACFYNNAEIVKDLIKNGANPNVVNKREKHSAFTLSCLNKEISDEIFDVLLPFAKLNDLGDGLPPIFLSMLTKNHYRLERLLQQGADVNIRLISDSNVPITQAYPQYTALKFAIERNDVESVKLLLRYGAKLEKDELRNVLNKQNDKVILLFIQFPEMSKKESKSQQLQLLFYDYAHPSEILGIFPTTKRHYKTYAKKISDELLKPENKNINDAEIKQIIEKIIEEIPGGRNSLKNGEFKKRIDFVLDHFLKESTQLVKSNDIFFKTNNVI